MKISTVFRKMKKDSAGKGADGAAGGKIRGKLRRNRMIITAFAIMIAVAGYLNYADRIDSAKSGQEAELEAANAAADAVYENDAQLNSGGDIESLDVDYDLVLSEDDLLEEVTETETPGDKDGTNAASSGVGESLFVSSTGVLTFVAEAKLSREQARAKSKETLLEIVDNDALSESARQSAIDAMVELANIAAMESAVETLLEAKGFANAVVTIQEDAADVIVNAEQISDSERAQIEDIITQKTGIAVGNITIVPLRESGE